MEINLEYKDRYLKYKNKYIALQKQLQQRGGMQAAQPAAQQQQGLRRTPSVAAPAAQQQGQQQEQPSYPVPAGTFAPRIDTQKYIEFINMLPLSGPSKAIIDNMIGMYGTTKWIDYTQDEVNKEADDLLIPIIIIDILLGENLSPVLITSLNRGDADSKFPNYETDNFYGKPPPAMPKNLAFLHGLYAKIQRTRGAKLEDIIILYLAHEMGKCVGFLSMMPKLRFEGILDNHDPNGEDVVKLFITQNFEELEAARLFRILKDENFIKLKTALDVIGHTANLKGNKFMDNTMAFAAIDFIVESGIHWEAATVLVKPDYPEWNLEAQMKVIKYFIQNTVRSPMFGNNSDLIENPIEALEPNLLTRFSIIMLADFTQIGEDDKSLAKGLIDKFLVQFPNIAEKLEEKLTAILKFNIENSTNKIHMYNPAALARKVFWQDRGLGSVNGTQFDEGTIQKENCLKHRIATSFVTLIATTLYLSSVVDSFLNKGAMGISPYLKVVPIKYSKAEMEAPQIAQWMESSSFNSVQDTKNNIIGPKISIEAFKKIITESEVHGKNYMEKLAKNAEGELLPPITVKIFSLEAESIDSLHQRMIYDIVNLLCDLRPKQHLTHQQRAQEQAARVAAQGLSRAANNITPPPVAAAQQQQQQVADSVIELYDAVVQDTPNAHAQAVAQAQAAKVAAQTQAAKAAAQTQSQTAAAKEQAQLRRAAFAARVEGMTQIDKRSVGGFNPTIQKI